MKRTLEEKIDSTFESINDVSSGVFFECLLNAGKLDSDFDYIQHFKQTLIDLYYDFKPEGYVQKVEPIKTFDERPF